MITSSESRYRTITKNNTLVYLVFQLLTQHDTSFRYALPKLDRVTVVLAASHLDISLPEIESSDKPAAFEQGNQ